MPLFLLLAKGENFYNGQCTEMGKGFFTLKDEKSLSTIK